MFAALAAALILAGPQDAPAPAFDTQALVTEAIGQVRPNAYLSSSVDWTALERELRAQAAQATDTADMLPVYRRLLEALGDHHSFVQPSAEATEAYKARNGRELYADAPRKPMASTFRGREGVRHEDVALATGRTARLIVVPQISGSGAPARTYAADLFSAAADAHERTCGYVVDLRGNLGGNVWPMLTGLSGLLGDGHAGLETKADGRVVAYAEIKAGAAVVLESGEWQGHTLMSAATWRPEPALRARPVAVLFDDATASSGEGVAVALAGRANTRSFGQPSLGVSTSNNGFMLSDGTNLVVTVGAMTDQTGRAYPAGLTPDEIVPFGPGSESDPADAQVEAAAAWLAAQPACAG